MSWRRLHRFAGVGLLGVFLAVHLVTNASALGGQASYDRVVGSIERSSLLPFFELVVLAALLIHVGYGVWLVRTTGATTTDAEAERWGGRRRWLLQRASAFAVLVFVLFHLWELRLQRLVGGLSTASLHSVLESRLSWTWLGVPWVALFYLFGIAAVVFHFANGLHAASATWRSPPSRTRARAASMVLAGVFFFIGSATVLGLATGTRLLPTPDADSAPCGSAVRAESAGPSR